MKVYEAYDRKYDRTFYLTIFLDTHDGKYRICNLTSNTIWDDYHDTIEDAENVIRHTDFSIEVLIDNNFQGINY